jgi:hypothetical protein
VTSSIALEKPMSDYDIITYILASLGLEYDPFFTSLTTRTNQFSVEDIYCHFLAQEIRLEQQVSSLDLPNSSAKTFPLEIQFLEAETIVRFI